MHKRSKLSSKILNSATHAGVSQLLFLGLHLCRRVADCVLQKVLKKNSKSRLFFSPIRNVVSHEGVTYSHPSYC